MRLHVSVLVNEARLPSLASLVDLEHRAAAAVAGGDVDVVLHDDRRGDVAVVLDGPGEIPELFAGVRAHADQASAGEEENLALAVERRADGRRVAGGIV